MRKVSPEVVTAHESDLRVKILAHGEMFGRNAEAVTGVFKLAPVARVGRLEFWCIGLSVIACEIDVFVESEI